MCVCVLWPWPRLVIIDNIASTCVCVCLWPWPRLVIIDNIASMCVCVCVCVWPWPLASVGYY